MSCPSTSTRPESGRKNPRICFSGNRFPDAAAAHDHAGLAAVDEETDVVKDDVIVERLVDVAEFDVVVGSRSVASTFGLAARRRESLLFMRLPRGIKPIH